MHISEPMVSRQLWYFHVLCAVHVQFVTTFFQLTVSVFMGPSIPHSLLLTEFEVLAMLLVLQRLSGAYGL